MGKFYAVAKGRNGEKIYTDWKKCEKDVRGFSGAVFKGFPSRAEAEVFIENNRKFDVAYHDLTEGYAFYVDGSYSDEVNKYAYAVLVLHNGKIVEEFSGSGWHKDYLELRNVAGEILGSLKAVQYAMDNEIDCFSITYDYTGIKEWLTGFYEAKNELSKEYARLMKEIMRVKEIKFIKVESHTGERYNERVDYLAKKALGLVD